jgi:AAA family ATP:ADP antiporter
MLRRLGIDLYPGEALPALLLFSSFFFSYTFQYTVKSVRQATFIDALGAERLPWVYLLVALCSYPILRLYSRPAERLSPQAMIATTCTMSAASLLVFWWLFSFEWSWVPLAFYIWVTILFVLLGSQLWSYANLLFDARQAKRLFGFIGAGGLLGSVAGGQVARFATLLTGTRDALLVAGALILLIVALLLPLRRMRMAGDTRVSSSTREAEEKASSGGFAAIKSSRQLQLISALLVVGVLVAQIVDLQFNWAVEEVTGDLDQRTVFFGNVFSIMGISAFAFQILFASRIHRTRGVGFSTRVLPITIFLGTGALLLTAGAGGAIIYAALALKISENGLRYSFDQSTRELLFLPVPAALRRKTKVFIDVFVQRGAKGLAALLLLPVTFGLISALQAGWMTLVLIAVWLVIAAAASREYVRSFRRNLKRRAVDTDLPINVADVTTLEILVQSLGSSDPRQVLHSLDILASNDRHHLVPPLLLYHDDAEVRLKTLQILGQSERQEALHLVERRLNDESPDVQAEAIRVLAILRNEDACDLMLPRLVDVDPRVRGTAIACLVNHGQPEMYERASTTLVNMLLDGSPEVRVEAAKALGAVNDAEFSAELLKLLYDSDPRVVRQAITAIRSRTKRDGANPIYLPTLISLLQQRRLKHEARETLVEFGEAAVPALIHFLNDSEESLWVRRAIPKTIARIGTPSAGAALSASLGDRTDTFMRRKLIESLALLRLESPTRLALRPEIAVESRSFLVTLADLYGLRREAIGEVLGPALEWSGDEAKPGLLEQLLAGRLRDHLHNIFGLLALTHDSQHIWSAYRTISGERSDLRGHSLEYLENTLDADVRGHVFAAIGDLPLPEKLSEAERLYGVRVEPRNETIARIMRLQLDGASDDSFLVAAAVYTVLTDRIETLYKKVAALRSSSDPFVRETADWVSHRLAWSPEQSTGNKT